MHNRWTMNLFLGFYVPILEEICTTFLGKVRAQQCESLIQKIPSNPTLQYGRDRPSPQTPVNNTVTIFCQRADTTSLISLPLMSSQGEFNWIQAIAKITEGQALNVHSQNLNVKKTSKLSANTQTVEQDIFPRERKKFLNLVHLTRGGQGLWREEWESLTQSSCRERLHVTGCSWLCQRPEKIRLVNCSSTMRHCGKNFKSIFVKLHSEVL